jgi:PKD domain
VLGLAVAAGLTAGGADASAAVDARVQGTFTMHGRITVAHNLPGVRPGQRVNRTWILTAPCSARFCRTLSLRRYRGRGVDTLTLRRQGRGLYRGSGTFFVPVRCGARLYRHGGKVPFTITLRVARVQVVQGVRFATGLTATYNNPGRINLTLCAGFLGHDAASYTGRLRSGVPAPPTAGFTFNRPNPVLTAVAFQDTSNRGANGAPIVRRTWNFGDPASGAANTSSSANPTHTFSGHGTFAVTETVSDGNGLTGRVTQQVTV